VSYAQNWSKIFYPKKKLPLKKAKPNRVLTLGHDLIHSRINLLGRNFGRVPCPKYENGRDGIWWRPCVLCVFLQLLPPTSLIGPYYKNLFFFSRSLGSSSSYVQFLEVFLGPLIFYFLFFVFSWAFCLQDRCKKKIIKYFLKLEILRFWPFLYPTSTI